MLGWIQTILLGLMKSVFGISKSGTTLTVGAAGDTVSIPGTVTAAAPAGTLTGATLAAGVLASSLTSVGALTSLAITGLLSTYKAVVTAGWGVPAVYGTGRVVGTADARAAAAATYTVGAADGSFEVSGNVLVTTSVTHSFSLDVSYTDESNVARTMILPLISVAGASITGGLVVVAGPFSSPVQQIRCKTATAITIRVSAGTFTSVTYNSEGSIKQVA